MRAAWTTLLAALAAASFFAGVPATAAGEPTHVVVVERVRDTVTLVCGTHDGKVACVPVHRARPYLTAVVTTGPAPLGPRPRAPHRRTPASAPARP
ncbi:hypothetical protein Amsp01_027880 [Amycolatopsis sp. NBRC 101858]|nr:hypothetical protein Amsp01_027880 [Amycolatopsis sp. NBRC 101858]